MLFMVIERFKNQDAGAVYARFRDKGRMAPEGLKVHGSWTEPNFDRCFQLMECDDLSLMPVSPSKDTAATVYAMLDKEAASRKE